jgi:hypothetical protein
MTALAEGREQFKAQDNQDVVDSLRTIVSRGPA